MLRQSAVGRVLHGFGLMFQVLLPEDSGRLYIYAKTLVGAPVTCDDSPTWLIGLNYRGLDNSNKGFGVHYNASQVQ